MRRMGEEGAGRGIGGEQRKKEEGRIEEDWEEEEESRGDEIRRESIV